ncbi:MFS general substrate transporter [Macroventuria anomochaeta]|uniref:MFS general substrate transporter n=1 Tax=Macroventuria anomochaeta TaxID=301207 RepID=A0ACB6RYI2_9PLEO|nr:MFS general substrate transporter [Macroventuria anomochaeta]KAF2626219.1 MFS general substrate transporter [Macroventuria anomochaeta]
MASKEYTEDERRQLEHELNVKILPNTEIMADIGSHPSTCWKTAYILSTAMVKFTQSFDVSILVLGFSNFIWASISTSFGRRPVFLLSQLINFGTSMWLAKTDFYGSFMGVCIVNGVDAGPAETIMPEVIADIFFLHDRILRVGPIASGSMTEELGFRSFWCLNARLIGASFLMVVFMFPETRFKREDSLAVPTKHIHTDSPNEKGHATTIENALSSDDGEIHHVTTATPTVPNTARSRQRRVFQPNAHPFRSRFLDIWIPWKLFAFPIVKFAAFAVSWSWSSFLTINLTQSQVLSLPPYNFRPATVGFTNFAIIIGALIGLFTSGPLSDWIAARATRKNGGVREPEIRLPAMIPYVVVKLLGNIVVAVGYERKRPCEAIVIIGYTCADIQVAALPGSHCCGSKRP